MSTRYVGVLGTAVAALILAGCPPETGPLADFSAETRFGRAPLVVQFTDASDPRGGVITAWLWEFGDGGTSTDPNPIHTYTAVGAYRVSLTVTSEEGTHTARKASYIIVGDMWARTFGGAGDEYVGGIYRTKDNGYLIVGSTTSTTADDANVLLLKINKDGKELWSQTYGGSGADTGSAVVEMEGGDLLIVGTSASFGSGDQVYVIHTDAAGAQKTSDTYGGLGTDRGNDIQKTTDGGYIVVGEAFTVNQLQNAYLIKLNAEGKLSWSRTFHVLGRDAAYAVRPAGAEGYWVAGDTTEVANSDMFLAKTDTNGNPTWLQAYGATGNDWANALLNVGDGALLCGTFFSLSSSWDLFVIQTDKDGNEIWSAVFGGVQRDEGRDVVATGDAAYLAVGVTRSTGAGGADAYLVKFDGQGKALWKRTLGGSADDSADRVLRVGNTGFLVAGSTESYGAGGADIYLVQTNTDGYAPSIATPLEPAAE